MTDQVTYDDDLDRPVYGAAAIGQIAGCKNERQAFHFLERGYIDASKAGPRIWVSTKRRILRVHHDKFDEALRKLTHLRVGLDFSHIYLFFAPALFGDRGTP